MKHLTDKELIDYTLKFETDPVRVRLAKVMDNASGCLLDSLEYAGMDPETWLFENAHDAGQWIRHLENEIDYLGRELEMAQKECARLSTRSVAELLAEMNEQVNTANRQTEAAYRETGKLRKVNSELQDKINTWQIISS